MATETRGLIERAIGWSVQRRTTVLFLVVLVIGAGLWSFRTLRVDAFPDLTDVQVQILVEAPGLSPVEVERLTVTPIELALNATPRVVLFGFVNGPHPAAPQLADDRELPDALRRRDVAQDVEQPRALVGCQPARVVHGRGRFVTGQARVESHRSEASYAKCGSSLSEILSLPNADCRIRNRDG